MDGDAYRTCADCLHLGVDGQGRRFCARAVCAHAFPPTGGCRLKREGSPRDTTTGRMA